VISPATEDRKGPQSLKGVRPVIVQQCKHSCIVIQPMTFWKIYFPEKHLSNDNKLSRNALLPCQGLRAGGGMGGEVKEYCKVILTLFLKSSHPHRSHIHFFQF